VLATLRAGGPLWVVIALAVLLVPIRRARLRELWSRRAVRWWTLAVAVAMVQSVLWTYLAKATDLGDFTGGHRWSFTQAVRLTLERWRDYADEMVGVTAWLDTRMPVLVYLVWQAAAAAVVVWGLVLADRAGRWRLAAAAAGAIGVPTAMQIAYVNQHGFITQGRYLLPVMAGLPLLAAFLIQRYGLAADKSASLLRIYAIALLPLHLVCLSFTMVRWQRGLALGSLASMSPLGGPWHPPLGSALPLAAMVAGLVGLGWLLWRTPTGVEPAPVEAAAEVSPVSTGYRG